MISGQYMIRVDSCITPAKPPCLPLLAQAFSASGAFVYSACASSPQPSFARLSAALGLPESNTPRAVYVDLSWRVREGEGPGDFNGGIVMGDEHIDELLSGPPQRGLSVFLEWNGVPHDPRAL